jgi:hypothetical protein
LEIAAFVDRIGYVRVGNRRVCTFLLRIYSKLAKSKVSEHGRTLAQRTLLYIAAKFHLVKLNKLLRKIHLNLINLIILII